MFGQDAGSVPIICMSDPLILSYINGNEIPAKLLPPPQHPITTSGFEIPTLANCFLASKPIMVWCSITWLSTEPNEYLLSPKGSVTAASIASLMAIPKLSGVSGNFSNIFLPAYVSVLGLGIQLPPQVCIIILRNGF